MCRHLAYLGPATSARALLVDPPRGLAAQARAPRFVSLPSPDGFGVGWYEHGKAHRRRWTSPIWETSPEQLAGIRSAAIIASARAATPGGPIEEASTAPFLRDGHLFSLNGYVEGYRSGVRERLLGMVSRTRREGIEGDVDSSVCFALVLDQLDLQVSLREALVNVHRILRRFSPAPLNLLLTDGRRIAATASGHSLWVRHTASSAIVASEPLEDDPAWTPVPDDHVIEVSSGAVSTTAIDAPFVEVESPCARPARSLLGSD